MSNERTRKQIFIDEINQAMSRGPYKDKDPHLHDLYCIGLLRELLAYSAIDIMEVRGHIKELGARPPKSAG